MRVFASRVLAVVRSIPVGRVATYGDVAGLAGAPRAARAVGNIMRTCHEAGVPCHRVVAAGGRLGGYGGDEALKRHLLVAEGVRVVGTRIREFSRVRWRDQPTGYRRPPTGRFRQPAVESRSAHRLPPTAHRPGQATGGGKSISPPAAADRPPAGSGNRQVKMAERQPG